MKLKKIMEERHISICRLAKMTGLAQSTIWRYVHGEREPAISCLKKIAKALDVDLMDLID